VFSVLLFKILEIVCVPRDASLHDSQLQSLLPSGPSSFFLKLAPE
jgi:hypothetical protein